MNRDTFIGLVLFLGALAVALAYGWGLVYWNALKTLAIVISLGMAFGLFIIAWLGLEMMRTPSLEEIEKEVEEKGKKSKK